MKSFGRIQKWARPGIHFRLAGRNCGADHCRVERRGAQLDEALNVPQVASEPYVPIEYSFAVK